jgi:hypothetical protein
MNSSYRVYIKVLENGFEVEVPDMEGIKKAEAAHKKNMKEPMPYIGDMTKTYAAKSVQEVLKLVKGAVSKIPDTGKAEFDAAFDEAAEENR